MTVAVNESVLSSIIQWTETCQRIISDLKNWTIMPETLSAKMVDAMEKVILSQK